MTDRYDVDIVASGRVYDARAGLPDRVLGDVRRRGASSAIPDPEGEELRLAARALAAGGRDEDVLTVYERFAGDDDPSRQLDAPTSIVLATIVGDRLAAIEDCVERIRVLRGERVACIRPGGEQHDGVRA